MIFFDQLDLDLKKALENQKSAHGEFAEKQSRLLGEQLQLNRTKEKLLAERNATVPSICLRISIFISNFVRQNEELQ